MGTRAMTLDTGGVGAAITFHATTSSNGRPVFAQKVNPSPYFRWKGGLARCVAALLLVPSGAVMLILMLLIRLTSPGPAIYHQARIGQHGKKFTMYKLRTMRHNAEAVTGPVWTTDGDPRITRLGRILRVFHLDELPQLFNVIRGEMDLIGPRPERPEFASVLAAQIPGYLQRLAVRPGVTGLAQVNLPPDESLDCVRRKLALDLDYIENADLSMDVRTFFCTMLRMIGVRHGRAAALLGLYRTPRVWGAFNGTEAPTLTPAAIADCTAATGKSAVDSMDSAAEGTPDHAAIPLSVASQRMRGSRRST